MAEDVGLAGNAGERLSALAATAGIAHAPSSPTLGFLMQGWVFFAENALWLALLVGMAIALVHLRRQLRLQTAERRRERRMREELETYARLDPSVTQSLTMGMDSTRAAKALAKRVCRAIADKSVFSRVAMLLRDAEGRLVCVGSVGVDDRTHAALESWANNVMAAERGQVSDAGAGVGKIPAGNKSFSIPLGEWHEFDPEIASWALAGRKERRRWRRGLVAPLRTLSGRLVGAIVVCADGAELDGVPLWTASGAERAMSSIEALADKLARTIENEAMAERLLRTEKLAGLGQLAGGVAHALNNPLTAVLGFAELIAETSSEPRVRKDAATIAQEALKMRDTVQRLIEFWRPGQLEDAPVDVVEMLDELAAACSETLKQRGVRLVVTAGSNVPEVRGSRDRLRQVMEHLLNNAAQAIGSAREREVDEEHAIRITVSHDERTLHVILSDTGPGFREPGRVFDPFYTTQQPGQGTGLGLSICYGIVREHGGEISAFNLHPHGAAVVVELPVARPVAAESGESLLVVHPDDAASL
jgi:signal transduction histidine kinase